MEDSRETLIRLNYDHKNGVRSGKIVERNEFTWVDIRSGSTRASTITKTRGRVPDEVRFR